mmetsp:Transcript_22503/g.29437  ORF Transcript_22503/g.29437 Transcript_22503/m.29437 type:complete len:243 (+) Transcript_22503:465-1193(+)
MAFGVCAYSRYSWILGGIGLASSSSFGAGDPLRIFLKLVNSPAFSSVGLSSSALAPSVAAAFSCDGSPSFFLSSTPMASFFASPSAVAISFCASSSGASGAVGSEGGRSVTGSASSPSVASFSSSALAGEGLKKVFNSPFVSSVNVTKLPKMSFNQTRSSSARSCSCCAERGKPNTSTIFLVGKCSVGGLYASSSPGFWRNCSSRRKSSIWRITVQLYSGTFLLTVTLKWSEVTEWKHCGGL